MKGHKKHIDLVRPFSGYFCRSEWAFVGTKCSFIREVMKSIAHDLKGVYSLCIIDADHDVSASIHQYQYQERCYTFQNSGKFFPYDDNIMLSSVDGCLVNGNHYAANSQIVFIDPERKESLLKRIDQLNNIQAIVQLSEDSDSFDIIDKLTARQKNNVTRLTKDQIPLLSRIILKQLHENTAELKAVVLAGGKSLRMGTDKSSLNYHGKPQELYLADMLKNLGLEVIVSKSSRKEMAGPYNILPDTFLYLGPFGAICSAFQKDPNSAYLVVACDLPMVDKVLLKKLISGRDPSKVASCFKAKNKDFPEPLVSIYEPKSYSRFLEFLSLGYSCPRKMLINSDIKVIELDSDDALRNVNTREDFKQAIEDINSIRDAHLPSENHP